MANKTIITVEITINRKATKAEALRELASMINESKDWALNDETVHEIDSGTIKVKQNL